MFDVLSKLFDVLCFVVDEFEVNTSESQQWLFVVELAVTENSYYELSNKYKYLTFVFECACDVSVSNKTAI